MEDKKSELGVVIIIWSITALIYCGMVALIQKAAISFLETIAVGCVLASINFLVLFISICIFEIALFVAGRFRNER